ncbi:MAG: hypothetical protein WBP36_16335, partial [Thermoanaerobaculia bacterium]
MRGRSRPVTRAQDQNAPSLPVLATIAGALFLIWSNSFVAANYLLGGEGAAAAFDWISLSVARFTPAAPLCALYC